MLLGAGLAFSATAQHATLHVNPDILLEQVAGPHSVADVDRERYFRTYHIPGMFNEDLAAELKALGISPARGTGPYLKGPGGDKHRAGYSQLLDRQSKNFAQLYRSAEARYGTIEHAIAGGNYPESDKASKKRTGEAQADDTMIRGNRKGVQPEDFKSAVGLINEWLAGIRKYGGPLPTYFSALNEPDANWDNTPHPVQDFLDFSQMLAIKVKERFPEVKIAGPCTAWGHPLGDWRRWSAENSGWEKKYIEQVGDVSDAYDFHIYTKEYWAHGSVEPGAKRPANKQDSPNMHDQFNNGNIYVWDFGKAEAYLDLIYAHHQATWGEPSLPVIITEFGRQGVTPQLGPWASDYLHYLYGTTVTRLWMTFMDRPEVEMTVPFILPESDRGYGMRRGQALYTRPNASEDLSTEPTPFLGYYGFFKNLKGDRVVSRWEDVSPAEALGLFSIAARDGEELWILIHNAPAKAITLNLDLGATEMVGEARIARMRWEGEKPKDHTQAADGRWRMDQDAVETADLSELHLAAEETAIVRVRLTTDQPSRHQGTTRYFASATLLPAADQGNAPASFNIQIPELSPQSEATLVAGISSPTSFKTDTPLKVWVNDYETSVALDFPENSRDLFAPLRIAIPQGVLRSGENSVRMQIDGIKSPDNSKFVTVRIDVANPHQPFFAR
ncbi:MAG: hypothetical protein AAGA25_14215 [Planctomycetota bacterium]